jgi:hypothetical protein
MGYPNPQLIPLPSEVTFRGICVYVPDKPEYLRALLGSLAGLAQWVNWERDENQSASKSANLWKLANDRTLETWSYDCSGGCMSFDCEEMKDCLIEIAKEISVNVTVNVDNSCGGGTSTVYCVNDDGDIIINPPPVTDTPIEPVLPLPPDMTEPPVVDLDDPEPPDGFETWEAYNAKACETANAIYDWYAKVLDKLIELLTEEIYQITAVFVIFFNLYTGGWGVVFSRAMLLKLAELFSRLAINTDIFVAALLLARQDLIENKSEIICELYTNRENVGDWENMIVTRLFNLSSGGMDATTDKPLYLDLLRYLLSAYSSLNMLYGAITYSGTPDPYDCSQCEESEPGPWNAIYTGGHDGQTSYAETHNTRNRIAAGVSLFRSTQFDAYAFYVSLEMPDGLGSSSFNAEIAHGGVNPGWRMEFYNEGGALIAGETLVLNGSGTYEKTFASGNAALVRWVTLFRQDEGYFEGGPRSFTFDFSADWVA